MIEVITVDTERHKVDATSWHVDEDAGLHLRDQRKNPIASFAPKMWIGVRKIEDAPRS